jgi:phosphosulfolactate synthase (CoM biosynthesis protein A)
MQEQASQNDIDGEEPMQDNEVAERTGMMVKQADMPKAETGSKTEKANEQIQQEETKEEIKDLISEYMQYLTEKHELAMEIDQSSQPEAGRQSTYVQELLPFDIVQQKQ